MPSANNEITAEPFTRSFWEQLGSAVARLANESNSELEAAWLRGSRQKINVSIVISDERPAAIDITLKSITSRVETAVKMLPTPPILREIAGEVTPKEQLF